MSLKARRELLLRIKKRYQCADWSQKHQLLDAFVQATGSASCLLGVQVETIGMVDGHLMITRTVWRHLFFTSRW